MAGFILELSFDISVFFCAPLLGAIFGILVRSIVLARVRVHFHVFVYKLLCYGIIYGSSSAYLSASAPPPSPALEDGPFGPKVALPLGLLLDGLLTDT